MAALMRKQCSRLSRAEGHPEFRHHDTQARPCAQPQARLQMVASKHLRNLCRCTHLAKSGRAHLPARLPACPLARPLACLPAAGLLLEHSCCDLHPLLAKVKHVITDLREKELLTYMPSKRSVEEGAGAGDFEDLRVVCYLFVSPNVAPDTYKQHLQGAVSVAAACTTSPRDYSIYEIEWRAPHHLPL